MNLENSDFINFESANREIKEFHKMTDFIYKSIVNSSVMNLKEDLLFYSINYAQSLKLLEYNRNEKTNLNLNAIFYEISRNKLKEKGEETFFPHRIDSLTSDSKINYKRLKSFVEAKDLLKENLENRIN